MSRRSRCPVCFEPGLHVGQLLVSHGDHGKLVGGLEHFLFFPLLGIIIPIDQYFFRGFETTSQQNVGESDLWKG